MLRRSADALLRSVLLYSLRGYVVFFCFFLGGLGRWTHWSRKPPKEQRANLFVNSSEEYTYVAGEKCQTVLHTDLKIGGILTKRIKIA